MKQVADEMGVGRHLPPDAGRGLLRRPGAGPGEEVADPFFGGAGPERNACINCGECMTGCRHNAKNTLVKNYLYLAEQAGAVVHPLTTVTRVRPRDGGGYEVTARWTKAKLSRDGRRDVHRRPGGVLRRGARHPEAAPPAQGARATCRASPTGSVVLTRTNSEAILGAIAPRPSVDYSAGVAITSSFHPDEHTHIEPVRYGRGTNVMALMQTVLADEVPARRGGDLAAGAVDAAQRPQDLYDLNTGPSAP